MKTIARSMLLSGAVGVGILGFGAVPARAQAFGFGYASPGVSFGFNTGGFGYGAVGYPAPVVGGYPAVVGGPVIVGGAMVAPRPVIVPGPVIVPRGYYGGYYRGHPYRHGWR
jgi:hypothetical protein